MDDFWEAVGGIFLGILRVIWGIIWEFVLEKVIEVIFAILFQLIWEGIKSLWGKLTAWFSRKKQEKEERACNMPEYPADELCEIKTTTEG